MGEAKTTVELDRPVSGKAVGPICGGFRHPHGDFAHPLIAETVRGAVQMRPRFFIVDIGVNGRMFERLILTDDFAELFARLQIADGVIVNALRAAAHFGALQQVGGLFDMPQCGRGARDVQQCGAGYRQTIE